MSNFKLWLLCLLVLGVFNIQTEAKNIVGGYTAPETATSNNTNASVQFRNDCDNATQKFDQAINNVRSRLLTGGDVWWDPGAGEGRYIVPKVPAGVPEVSSIFAGAVWLGGIDPAGNLKVAAQTYGSSSGNSDFFPGPLDPVEGTTNQEVCSKWDKFFTVLGSEIDEHLRNFEQAEKENRPYDPLDIPKNVRGWPAKGNQFFFDVHQFELPNTSQGLAGFWDQDNDGFYEPDEGDFPIIEIRGCLEKPQYPDEMVFWIYNDNGNIHASSGADPIQMEIQVQAFSYATNDEINDMTFQRYKLINRAIESIDSTYFAMWVDADLGCHEDDYIGCDTLRSLAFVYNADAEDGTVGCNCGSTPTYCDQVPIVGVDYFRGPLDENGLEIGMSSFTYFNNPSFGSPLQPTTDPSTAQEYYNYLSGSWRSGEPFTFGGDAYQDGEPINFAFTEAPDDPNGWSMCTTGPTINSPEFDRRTVQASGPFRLDPGAVNELIIGVVWVADQDYPCPSIRAIQSADDVAQALFDNCFDITDGPDAPDMDIIELDRELIFVLTNDTITSNNAYEAYAEEGLTIPATAEDNLYRFEGYKIFQLSSPDVTLSDFDDPDKARQIFHVDIKNGVEKIYNWVAVESSLDEVYYSPVLMNEGVTNDGIRHTFSVTTDQFAAGDSRLVNHKKYYFTVLAYAYNNYIPFEPADVIGQRLPYLEGRRNIGENGNPYYTAIPRKIVDENINAVYGDGAVITRIDGLGNGGNFLAISQATENAILDGSFNGEITYQPGAGPISVKIVNPLEVKDGEFILTFEDGDMSDETLAEDARWKLTNVATGEAIASETTIAKLNEQVLTQFGISLAIGQTADVGDAVDATNGAIAAVTGPIQDGAEDWLIGVREGSADILPQAFNFLDQAFDFAATNSGEVDEILDPDQALTRIGNGYWIPYTLANWRTPTNFPFYMSPGWQNSGSSIARTNNDVQELNNVDIVFTSDKSKWSRCPIVETWNESFDGVTLLQPVGDAKTFDVRQQPSVGKEDADGDGLPDPDGATDDDGDPIMGMGWFPGYAIDVETGQRLNIFFGENSLYREEFAAEFPGAINGKPNGGDMMWNPSTQTFISPDALGGAFNITPINMYLGGQHYIYVTRQPYDEGFRLWDRLKTSPSPLRKVKAMQDVTWTTMPVLAPGQQMKSYAEGLIPADYRVQLRVDNPYQVEVDMDSDEDVDTRTGTGVNSYHPAYRFTIDGKAPTAHNEQEVENALDLINVVPNPYYGYSAYEISQFSTIVKITNLPAKCVVTIYSLDGKFIRQYNRDETPGVPQGNNRGVINRQIAPALEWDLKNNKGIPVASGMYLIHVEAEGLGERIIKWFGVSRRFDPSGL